MRVLVFRHGPDSDAGYIRPALESRGIAVECIDLYRGDAALPDPTRYDGLISLGGEISANDDLPYLKQEIRVIREAVERAQPVLGVCLGAQLMACALGAAVYRSPAPEFGWYSIRLASAANDDPLFSRLGESLTVFQWHEETFEVPSGGLCLASSEACRNQAFRYGQSAWGVQFHPEVTPEMIVEWNRDAVIRPDPKAHVEVQRALAEHLFGRWAGML